MFTKHEVSLHTNKGQLRIVAFMSVSQQGAEF